MSLSSGKCSKFGYGLNWMIRAGMVRYGLITLYSTLGSLTCNVFVISSMLTLLHFYQIHSDMRYDKLACINDEYKFSTWFFLNLCVYGMKTMCWLCMINLNWYTCFLRLNNTNLVKRKLVKKSYVLCSVIKLDDF